MTTLMVADDIVDGPGHPDRLPAMHPALNPFQPGSGRKPPKFSGRGSLTRFPGHLS